MKKELYPIEKNKPARLTGTVVPLGALYTRDCTSIGEFPALIELASFCKKAGMGIIQLLPVNDTGTQSSPYSGLSAFALHPIYISIPLTEGFSVLYRKDKAFTAAYDTFVQHHTAEGRYDYQGILDEKTAMLRMLYGISATAAETAADSALSEWIKDNPWIIPYAVFKQLKWKYMQASWKSWPAADRAVTAESIRGRWNDTSLKKEHLFYAWVQYQAWLQFTRAAAAVKAEGIILKGDMPIMMNEDSCDAWAEPLIFNHTLRAGSPPDGENPDGQSWGFPIYNWDNLKTSDYTWWKKRLQSAAQFYGAYRLDHILGFFRIWAVPEKDTDAYLGHAEPYVPILRAELAEAGFDEGRIHWLSEPHIPTSAVEDITWNHETAHAILSAVADQLGNEELWNFKKTVTGSKMIIAADFGSQCTPEAAERIKKTLCEWWKNRCLIQLKKDSFVPVWSYRNSNAWNSLNNDEKSRLEKLFSAADEKQNLLWRKHAETILSVLTGSVQMIPCGEDLGVNLKCVPEVLKSCGILGLRVVRWSRMWDTAGQPYIPFAEYTPLSVTTTSVHDSSTLRQWWNTEKDAVKLFAKTYTGKTDADGDFTPEAAQAVLSATAESAGVWCIHPLQDFLYLRSCYWRQDADSERINIPGTVSSFNWTYRLPVSLETLLNDAELASAIHRIADIHTGRSHI